MMADDSQREKIMEVRQLLEELRPEIEKLVKAHDVMLKALKAIVADPRNCNCQSVHSWYGGPEHDNECPCGIAEFAIAQAERK